MNDTATIDPVATGEAGAELDPAHFFRRETIEEQAERQLVQGPKGSRVAQFMHSLATFGHGIPPASFKHWERNGIDIPVSLLHELFGVWCHKHGHNENMPVNIFGRELNKYTSARKFRGGEGCNRPTYYAFPSRTAVLAELNMFTRINRTNALDRYSSI